MMDFIEKKNTFIMELGFLGMHSDVDSTTWRISVWFVFVSERCTQLIAWCAFSIKKIRRSGYKI
jgi:hypothetical protein